MTLSLHYPTGLRAFPVLLLLITLSSACARTRTALPRIQSDTVRISVRDTVFVSRIDTVTPYRRTGGAAEVTVFFATDRRIESQTAVNSRTATGFVKSFGAEPSTTGVLQFGSVTVSIPRNHRVGEIESPAWYMFSAEPDPKKHLAFVRAKRLESRTAFDSLRAIVERSTKKDAFVFIHGFNVDFGEAVMRTAQLAWDLGFDGAPILYSWPSKGSVLRYSADRNNAEWTAPHLRTFLDSVVAVTKAEKVHLIAHSMGAHALGLALKAMPAGVTPKFNQIILAAPDIDARIFRDQIAPAIRPLARQTTLYASANDRALLVAKLLTTQQRAGYTKPSVIQVDGITVIDATSNSTDLLGHGYFASNRAMVTDIFYLLKDGDPPNLRNLLKTDSPSRFWWTFRP